MELIRLPGHKALLYFQFQLHPKLPKLRCLATESSPKAKAYIPTNELSFHHFLNNASGSEQLFFTAHKSGLTLHGMQQRYFSSAERIPARYLNRNTRIDTRVQSRNFDKPSNTMAAERKQSRPISGLSKRNGKSLSHRNSLRIHVTQL